MSTRNSNPEPLASMLDIESPAALWGDEELETIFRHQLDTALSVDLGPVATEAGISTFGQLLSHPAPPVQILRNVKEFAKRARGSADAPLPPEIATILYFAAITAARLRLDRRITELDDATLAQSLTWCAARSWIDRATRQLFTDALVRLSGDSSNSEDRSLR